MKNNFMNILYFGDFDCDTGYGVVSKNLIDTWSNQIENGLITVFATNNHKTEAYNYKDNVYVIPALATRENGDTDVYARKSFLKLLYNGRYTHLFCLNDIEVINALNEPLIQIRSIKKKDKTQNFKSIIYFPIDSEVRSKDLEVLNFFDKSITYTEYGKSVIRPLVSNLVYQKLSVIPHGTNLKQFFPIENKSELRKKHFPTLEDDVFIFGSVNRNSARKDFGTLLIAFSHFKKSQYDKSVLYLHCNPLDPFGINIYRLCERLNLEVGKDVLLPNNFNENKGFEVSELNELYNCMDCFVTTTTAEGWGLTITEAMATKTLVMCPTHTSLKEITDDGKNVIPLKNYFQTVYKDDYEKIRFQCDADEVVDGMNYAYNLDKTSLTTLSYDKVAKLDWKKISLKFYDIIKSI